MIQIVEEGLPFPSSWSLDLSNTISFLSVENSVLNESQLLGLLEMLHTSGDIFSFLKSYPDRFNNLRSILGNLKFDSTPTKLIEEVIDTNGLVKTSASQDLAHIRRSLQRTRVEVHKVYQSTISKLRKQGWTAESEESSRNGRRVIAIVAEQKRVIKGIIHDVSSTGKTVFIEPQETISINNNLLDLEQQEKLEVYRILRELSGHLRQFDSYFKLLHDILGKMDLNFGKALFARQIGAIIPALQEQSFLDLKHAIHPLLKLQNSKIKKETIPFDLMLDHVNRILIISGPNAGGKTVCMKTIGLLQLMVQSGLPVTTNHDSVFGIFDTVLVDIGDSQSIEYELSTYSSRLKHMKVFLENTGNKTLFLIDEFGTGTDPSLGGALAEAVLEDLNTKKSFGVITTHYLNLKVMADQIDGIFNGSMEFDLKGLKPLFNLVTGKPGSSYTFLVAERSGLPKSIIKSARKKVPRKTLLLEKLLGEVENEKLLLSHKMAEAQQKDNQLKEIIKNYEKLSYKLSKEAKDKAANYKKLELGLRKNTEQKFKSFLKEWKKSKDKKEVIEKYYRNFVGKKPKVNSRAEQQKTESRLLYLQNNLKPGMMVKLVNGNSTGVVEKVTKNKAYILFGDFRTKCDIINLEIVNDQGTK